MDMPTDEQLVKSYLKGDQKALEILIQRYLNPLYNFVFKYVHTIPEAEDVTQEAFVKIWRNAKKFDKKFKFKTWAYTIAKNTALDALKKKSLIPFAELDDPQKPETFGDALVSREPLPEQVLMQIEDAQLLGHTTSLLPEKYGEIISLRYSQGLNFREIASLLKLSINTVKTRHRRALVHLKKLIKEN